MNRLLPALVLLTSSLTLAEDPRFARLRASAEPLGGLGAFLEQYVGECGNPLESGPCRQNAEAYRRKANGKKFYALISEDQAGMLSPGPVDPARGEFVINVMPFFPASAYALTHGKPHRTDAKGNPVMPFIPIKAKIPDDQMPSTVARMFSSRPFRVALVFTPTGLWALPKHGGGRTYGVQARIEGMQITNGRSGQDVAFWTGR